MGGDTVRDAASLSPCLPRLPTNTGTVCSRGLLSEKPHETHTSVELSCLLLRDPGDRLPDRVPGAQQLGEGRGQYRVGMGVSWTGEQAVARTAEPPGSVIPAA